MLKARRANVTLRIKPEEKDFYLGKGFSIYEDEQLIQKAAPQTLNEYIAALAEAQERIAQLEAELEVKKAKKNK